MKRIYAYAMSIALILSFAFISASAATFTAKSNADGNWSNPATWTVVGVDADGIRDADDDVVIPSVTTNRFYTIDISNAFCNSISFFSNSTNGAASTLVVGANSLIATLGIAFNSNSGNALTLSGITVSTGSITTGFVSWSDIKNFITFTGSGTLNITSGDLPTGGTFTKGSSTVNFSGSSLQFAGLYDYYTLKSNNTAGLYISGATNA